MENNNIQQLDLVVYKTMARWKNADIPAMFTQKHNTKENTYARLNIINGKVKFYQLDEEGNTIATFDYDKNNQPAIIEPQQWHKVEPLSDDLECFIEFLCERRLLSAKKYNLSPTHSEIVSAWSKQQIKPCKTLDLGSGQGRNAIYLSSLNFNVDCVDCNQNSISFLETAMDKDPQLKQNLSAQMYDINSASIEKNYDFIYSTVVFMFLDADRIKDIIANMQQHTNIGGLNLIVCAMQHKAPAPNFNFTFSDGELKQYYQGWEFLKYEEKLGKLMKTDANGNPVELKFVTMLAKKVN